MKEPLEEDDFGLPLAPLLGVALLLVIFLLVFGALSAGERRGQERDAAAEAASPPGPREAALGSHLVIGVHKDGSVTLDGQPIGAAELRDRLEAATAAGQKPQVLVLGEKDATFDDVMSAYQLCVKYGFPDARVAYVFEGPAPAP